MARNELSLTHRGRRVDVDEDLKPQIQPALGEYRRLTEKLYG